MAVDKDGPEPITKTVLNAIDGKFENDNVDWLTLVNEKNDLKKFFSY